MTASRNLSALIVFAFLVHYYLGLASPGQQSRSNCAAAQDNAGLQLGFPIHVVNPVVPRKVRKAGFLVLLTGTMTAAGTFENLSFERGSPEFAEAAVDAVRQWRYTPPTRNGRPTDARVYIMIQSGKGGFNRAIDEDPSTPTQAPEQIEQQISDGELFRSNAPGVAAPRATYAPDPQYSELARVLKYDATVELRLIVGVDGRPKDVWVTRGAGLGLDQKSVEALCTWKFEPGKRNGVPVPVLVSAETQFRIY